MSDKKVSEIRQIKGLPGTVVKKLEKKGFTTVEALATLSVMDLKKMGMEEEQAKGVLRQAWGEVSYGFIPASELEKKRGNEFLTTGCRALDGLLGGGVMTRDITELIGSFGCGKTQTLLSILVENLGQHKGWGAVFLDSEGTFRVRRVREIAKARGHDAEDIVERIIVVNAPASEQFMLSVDELPSIMKKNNVKIIFLDSLIATFRSEYTGREVLWRRQQLINHMLRKLLNYATIFNVAVVVSNQVVSRPDTPYMGDITQIQQPAGGNIVAHACDTRLYFRKAGRTKRIARLIDSSWRPEFECVFRVSTKGIEDVEEEA